MNVITDFLIIRLSILIAVFGNLLVVDSAVFSLFFKVANYAPFLDV